METDVAVKHLCPDCEQLIEISPTGLKQVPDSNWSAQWWVLHHHKHPTRAELCDGSGKRV